MVVAAAGPEAEAVVEQTAGQRPAVLDDLPGVGLELRPGGLAEADRLGGDRRQVRTALEQTLLSERDPQVRKAVAELFGRLQDKSTLRVLKQANADDSDRAVRQAAYKAIIMMEGY